MRRKELVSDIYWTSTSIFVFLHILLGYLIGPSVLNTLEKVDIPLTPVLIGVALLGLSAWLFMSRRQHGHWTQRALHFWTDSACPACVIAGHLGQR